MGIKNLLGIILVIAVMFIGLGVYHKLVVEDILISSINKATTQVVNTNTNNLETKIDNKFKKIDNLTSAISTAFPIESKNEPKVKVECVPPGYSLVNDRRLSRKLLKEKEKTGNSTFH